MLLTSYYNKYSWFFINKLYISNDVAEKILREVVNLAHYSYYALLTFKGMIIVGYIFRQFLCSDCSYDLEPFLISRNAKGFSSTRPSFPLPFPSGVNRCLCDPVYLEVSVNLSIAEFCEIFCNIMNG